MRRSEIEEKMKGKGSENLTKIEYTLRRSSITSASLTGKSSNEEELRPGARSLHVTRW